MTTNVQGERSHRPGRQRWQLGLPHLCHSCILIFSSTVYNTWHCDLLYRYNFAWVQNYWVLPKQVMPDVSIACGIVQIGLSRSSWFLVVLVKLVFSLKPMNVSNGTQISRWGCWKRIGWEPLPEGIIWCFLCGVGGCQDAQRGCQKYKPHLGLLRQQLQCRDFQALISPLPPLAGTWLSSTHCNPGSQPLPPRWSLVSSGSWHSCWPSPRVTTQWWRSYQAGWCVWWHGQSTAPRCMEKRELDFPSGSDKSMHKNMLKKKKSGKGGKGLRTLVMKKSSPNPR